MPSISEEELAIAAAVRIAMPDGRPSTMIVQSGAQPVLAAPAAQPVIASPPQKGAQRAIWIAVATAVVALLAVVAFVVLSK
jgi:hypothetical protein